MRLKINAGFAYYFGEKALLRAYHRFSRTSPQEESAVEGVL